MPQWVDDHMGLCVSVVDGLDAAPVLDALGVADLTPVASTSARSIA